MPVPVLSTDEELEDVLEMAAPVVIELEEVDSWT
jgi:hypothetical protein